MSQPKRRCTQIKFPPPRKHSAFQSRNTLTSFVDEMEGKTIVRVGGKYGNHSALKA
jgi:hypothetical protein